MDVGTLVIAPAVEAVLSALLHSAASGVGRLRNRDPISKALELALGRAIKDYATTDNGRAIAGPLLVENSFLTEPDVAEQIARVIQASGEPDFSLLGQRWEAALGGSETFTAWDFASEAQVLVGYLRDELARLAPTQPILAIHAIGDVGDAVQVLHRDAVVSLSEIDSDLKDVYSQLTSLVTTVQNLGASLLGATPDIRSHIYDQTSLIEEKTRGFLGRRFVFEGIDEFIASADHGYCCVVARPGLGKTALMAILVKNRGLVHHFNVLTANITSPRAFLGNVCAQLISHYLPGRYNNLPARATADGGTLMELLSTIASQARSKIIIAVDALDEADASSMPPGSNPLWLPESVPQGCYFVVSIRGDEGEPPPRLSVRSPQRSIVIDHLGEPNMADIRAYVRSQQYLPGIVEYIRRHGLTADTFVELLAEKSEGNFMYLHHVLPDIDRGLLQDRALEGLPIGLWQYYSDQLERMRGRDETAWFDYKIPVIVALSAERKPLTVGQIAESSGIRERGRIVGALQEWAPFLETVPVTYSGRRLKAYKIYHSRFHDFLRDQVSGVSEGIIEAEDRIIDAELTRYLSDQ
ncbi:hypothetical protein ACI784_09310 [Geodermatophilus sp. SYSU D01186]